MTRIRGFSKAEYTEIKHVIKAEIPFRVAVSRNTTPRRALGTINIRPIKGEDGHRAFRDDQAEVVINFCKRHKLYAFGIPQEFALCSFWQGVSYIYREV